MDARHRTRQGALCIFKYVPLERFHRTRLHERPTWVKAQNTTSLRLQASRACECVGNHNGITARTSAIPFRAYSEMKLRQFVVYEFVDILQDAKLSLNCALCAITIRCATVQEFLRGGFEFPFQAS